MFTTSLPQAKQFWVTAMLDGRQRRHLFSSKLKVKNVYATVAHNNAY